MEYSLKQAAIATGKAKSTIHKAIKDGVVSANKNDRGHYKIDPAELHRVFPAIKENTSIERSNRTNPNREKTLEIRALEVAIEAKDELIEQVKSERDKIYGLITNQSKQATKEIMAIAFVLFSNNFH